MATKTSARSNLFRQIVFPTSTPYEQIFPPTTAPHRSLWHPEATLFASTTVLISAYSHGIEMAPRQPLRRTQDEDPAERAKEAVVPDVLRPEQIQRYQFIDNNRYRRPETLTKTFGYEPALDPFTPEEELIFAEAFKDKPKDFVAIASLLPARTSKQCIQHYYANKADARFKTESRRQREKINGPRKDMYIHEDSPSSDMQPEIERKDEDLDAVPINDEIKRLKDVVGQKKKKSFHARGPGVGKEPVMLPRPDLSVLRMTFQPPLDLSEEKLLAWLRSANLLLLVKQWKELCLDRSELYVQMQQLLGEPERPWEPRTEQIADFAAYYGEQEFELKIKTAKATMLCSNFAAKIANSNAELFEQFKPYGFPKLDRMRAGVRVLFTAYDDLRRNPGGFFAILLNSEVSGLVSAGPRKLWEKKYPFEDEDEANREEEERLHAQTATTQLKALADTTRPQHRLSKPKADSRAEADVSEAPDTEEELELEPDQRSDASSDGIPEHGELAVRGLRAKAAGLEDAVMKIHNRLREREGELERVQAELRVANEDISKLRTEIEKLKRRNNGREQ